MSGFQPISSTSSKPLPPLLHSSGSIGSSHGGHDDEDFDSYFDVKVPPPGQGAAANGHDRKGKGKMLDHDMETEFGVGLGLPPRQASGTFLTRTTSSQASGAGGPSRDEPIASSAQRPTATTKRSFSLPTLFKRKPSSSKIPPTSKEGSGDVTERLKNSIAGTSAK